MTRRGAFGSFSFPSLVSVLIALVIASGLTGCGGEESQSEDTTTSESQDPLADTTVKGSFEVADDGRRLQLTCWGEGSPTVVLEAGHPEGTGIADFGTTAFARALATETRVCAYDRAGWGASDPAPDDPRSADDVVEDLHALLEAADVDAPLVLAGSSFGGMIVSYYAEQYPDDVDGVVLLDVPAPSATLSVAEIPEIAWDHPTNPEHVDVAPAFENRFAKDPVSFPAPLVVVTATHGQSDVKDQGVWLRASRDARQVELDGGHTIYLDDPTGAAAEVLTLVRGD
jgi:thioesterase domain-containing protein